MKLLYKTREWNRANNHAVHMYHLHDTYIFIGSTNHDPIYTEHITGTGIKTFHKAIKKLANLIIFYHLDDITENHWTWKTK